MTSALTSHYTLHIFKHNTTMLSYDETPFKKTTFKMQWFNQWRKRIADWSHAFDNIFAAFRLVFQASPVATLVMLAVTILEGLLVPAQAWMHKLVADRAIELFQTGTDAWNGFHSVPIHPDDKHYTTFITPWGRYRYKVAPQGFIASGDGYSRRFDEIIADIERKSKCVDDTIM